MISLSVPNSQSLKGTVQITCSASPPPDSVDFYLDDVLTFSDPTSPFIWDWDTTTATDGIHIIKAISRRKNGNSQATLTVKVTNATPPPVGSAPVNTALPTLQGPTSVGGQLLCYFGNWSNSPTSYTTQWYRCDAAGANAVAIAGTVNADRYTTQAADVGKTIRCGVRAYNSFGASAEARTVQSAVIVDLAPTNTSAPTISGVAQQGQTLTANPGIWTGSPTSYQYQWYYENADGTGLIAIQGYTAQTYTPVANDVGGRNVVRVTALNGSGSSSPVFSAPTGVIAAAAAPPTVPTIITRPSISGTPQVGKTLTANPGTWTGNPTSYEYQWYYEKADGTGQVPIQGYTQPTYTPVALDVGGCNRVSVVAINGVGRSLAAFSLPTAVVTAATPVGSVPSNTTLPSISGSLQVGSVMTASDGVWTNSPTSYSRQWYRCDPGGANAVAIAGQTGTTYTTVSADIGKSLRVYVIAYNTYGASSQAISPASGTITTGIPANTGLPSISGTPQATKVLTANPGVWTNSPTSYQYQWYYQRADGTGRTPIIGFTSQTYTPVANDVGGCNVVSVVALNGSGASAPVFSNPTAVIQSAPVSGGGGSTSTPPTGAYKMIWDFAGFNTTPPGTAPWKLTVGQGAGSFSLASDGEGGTCLRQTVAASPGGISDGYLTAVSLNPPDAHAGYGKSGVGEVCWYAADFRHPTGFVYSAGSQNWMMEWHEQIPQPPAAEAFHSNALGVYCDGTVGYAGTNPRFRVQYSGGTNITASGTHNIYTSFVPPPVGQWFRVVANAGWYGDSRGFLKIWVNGIQVANITGTPTLGVYPDGHWDALGHGLYHYPYPFNVQTIRDMRRWAIGPTQASVQG